MSEPNRALRAARERARSRRVPGEPLSRVELADAVNAWLWTTTGQRYDLDHHLVGKWERGAVARPIAAYRAALRAVLGVADDADLGFVVAARPGAVSPPVALDMPPVRADGPRPADIGPWHRCIIVTETVEAVGQDVITRRDAMRGAAVLGGAGLLGGLAGWLEPLAGEAVVPFAQRRGAFTVAEVEALEHVTATFRAWRSGGTALGRSAVVGQLSDVAERLGEAPDDPLTSRVFLVAAELSKIAGSMSYDAGLSSLAQRHYVGAVRLAKAGGHGSFGAVTLAALARLLLDAGQPHDALEVVAMAQHGTRHTATPALRSMLATRQAWGHAQRGEPYAFARAVDDAETAHAAVVAANEPRWLHGLDDAELHGTIGARYRDLARHDARHARHAVTYIGRALAERDPGRARNRAFDLVSLARVHLLTGDHDHAADTVRDALPLLDPARPGRLGRKLAEWRQEAAPYAGSGAVRAARDDVAALLPRGA